MRARSALLLVAVALAACGASSSGGSSPKTTASSLISGGGGFQALDGKQLPGTSSADWGQIQAESAPPPPATGYDAASSMDLTYNLAIFDFSSATDATAFYSNPPPSIRGFVAGASGYTPLDGATGVPGPSKGLDLRTCAGESGTCAPGVSTFSAGVALIIQRGSIVIFLGYLTGSQPPHGRRRPRDGGPRSRQVPRRLSPSSVEKG